MDLNNKFVNIHFRNTIVDITPIISNMGYLEGINLKFREIDSNQVHVRSDGSVVHEFPLWLEEKGINLDIKALSRFNGALCNTLSSYLYALRKPLNNGTLNIPIKSSLQNDIDLNVHVTKYFYREENKGRNKIDLSFFVDDQDFGRFEEIQISFTKRDTNLLSALIREVMSTQNRIKPISLSCSILDSETKDVIDETIVSVMKVDNSIVFGDIWLHGQEILNTMYLSDQLMFEMGIENNTQSLRGNYRQISISDENGIVYLTLKKKNIEHQDVDNKEYKFILNTELLSLLYMYQSIKIFRHADIEFEDDKNVEDLVSQNIFKNMKGVKYHLSLKESSLGLSILKKKGQHNISLVGVVKEHAYRLEDEETGDVFENVFEKNGEKKKILTEFNINLKNQWMKLINALSYAYTKEYENHNRDYNFKRFFVINQDHKGKFKYSFSILSNKENKAAAVLSIDKYELKNAEEVLISSFRQPLFKKYVYQLLIMIIASSEFMEDIDFVNKVNKLDLIKFRYKSMKNVIKLTKNEEVDYGIKKVEGATNWGIFSNSNKMYLEINKQDQFLLSESSYNRILRGDWLPFTGDLISIGPDRYITDLYGEINLEKEESSGLIWASKIYFGTNN